MFRRASAVLWQRDFALLSAYCDPPAVVNLPEGDGLGEEKVAAPVEAEGEKKVVEVGGDEEVQAAV